ncbi:MAG: hypothetical protein U1F16_04155 [Turneriella sp.]
MISTLSSVTVNGVAAIIVSKETGTACPGHAGFDHRANNGDDPCRFAFCFVYDNNGVAYRNAQGQTHRNRKYWQFKQGGRIAIVPTAIRNSGREKIIATALPVWATLGPGRLRYGQYRISMQGCDVAISADGNP